MSYDDWFLPRPKLSLEEQDEEYYFENWKDDSCANYVGWLLETPDFNLIVSRENPAKAGLYDLTKVKPGIHSGSDPFGENPDLWKDTTKHLNIAQVAIKVIRLIEEYGTH